jgi:peptidoglycan/LPS O-acetylase OafA/YrhL
MISVDQQSINGCLLTEQEGSSSPTIASGRPRLDGIDVLRGLSILAVILLHINIRIPLDKSALGQFLSTGLPRVLDLHRILVWNGYNGVIIFFAVSGFLITTNCLQRWGSLRDVDIRGFYRLRFARIAPLLLALLTLSSVLHFARVQDFVINPAFSWPQAMFSALTFHLNWLEAKHNAYLPPSLDVLWSLSVEEMFYLFFPLVCFGLRGGRALIVLLLAFVAAGPFARTLTTNEMWADHSYLSCMDAIALGCLAAMAAKRFVMGRRALLAVRIIGLALMILVTCFRRQCLQFGLYKHGLDVTVLALGTALLLMVIAQRGKPGSSLTAPLRWFGRNSYEVYLTHSFITVTLTQLFVATGNQYAWTPLWLAAVVSLSGVLGACVARYYSEPLNRKLRAGWVRAGTKQ